MNGGGNRGEQRASPTPWVRQVMEHGDYKLLDRKARELAQQLGDEASRAQIRTIFGAVRRLSSLSGDERRRELAMLRPRVSYAAARSEKLRRLKEALVEAIDVAEERPEERTAHLVDLAEAILCYALSARAERDRGPKPHPESREAQPSPPDPSTQEAQP